MTERQIARAKASTGAVGSAPVLAKRPEGRRGFWLADRVAAIEADMPEK
jgi:hypothetical protein